MSVLEMKVPSPGESISEVEIATWLVSDGDYVEKDQAIAEVDSDKATLELPAEDSGVITLKAAEGDVVKVGQVVCLIDTSAARPEGSAPAAPKAEEKTGSGSRKSTGTGETGSSGRKGRCPRIRDRFPTAMQKERHRLPPRRSWRKTISAHRK